MSRAQFLLLGLLQFPLVGVVLLLCLSKLRPWAFDFRIREKLFAWCLYVPYILSALFFLTSVVSTTVPDFNNTHYSVMVIVFFGIVFLVVPSVAYQVLMHIDPKMDASKKLHKTTWFFNFVDFIILFLLAQPAIFISMNFGGDAAKVLTPTTLSSTFFIIILVGLLLYKNISLQKRVNETRAWWIIGLEWILLIAVYAPLLFTRIK